MMTVAKAFGASVRRLRASRGYSQEGFAHHSGTSRTYMSEIERGVTNVSLDRIEKITEALGLSMSQLLAEVEREAREVQAPD